MIERAEAKITREMEERDRLAAERAREEAEQQMRELAEQNKDISDLFNKIANAKDVTTANKFINEALQLFESPDAVVLIRLNNYGDYDRPTTAVNYLNYLKDQKKVTVNVDNIKYNEENKITELELIKK